MGASLAREGRAAMLTRRLTRPRLVLATATEAYSIAEGEALPFRMGKRMLTTNEGATSRARGKGGFLVYECAARALQAALVRPKGKLATATKAVLRVTASRPCAPPHSKWPTNGGVWAFEVIVPVSIAVEQQTWMEDRTLASLWLPASPPGLCKQCALGERVCVQVRNHLEMGQPPAKGKQKAMSSVAPDEAGSAIGSFAPASALVDPMDPDNAPDQAWGLAPGETPELDFRAYA